MDEYDSKFSTCQSEQNGKTLWVNKICRHCTISGKKNRKALHFLICVLLSLGSLSKVTVDCVCNNLYHNSVWLDVDFFPFNQCITLHFLKSLWVFSEVSSSAIWDYRWWDDVFLRLSPLCVCIPSHHTVPMPGSWMRAPPLAFTLVGKCIVCNKGSL